MANDENDIPMSETSNQKAQKLPIYSNESKILKLLGQAQVADQKNNRYVQNFNCSGCTDVGCDYIYKIEKFTKSSSKLSKNMKQQIFIDTLIPYFKNHVDNCKIKEHALNFLYHYKNRSDTSSKFISMPEATAHSLFNMINKEDIFNIIKIDSKVMFVPDMLDMGNNQKLNMLCCNCRFHTFVNTNLMRTTSTAPSSIAMHTCENGSQEISSKRPISDVASINKENSITHAKKQKTNTGKRQINVMDILKKKNDKKPEEQNSNLKDHKSRLQKLSPADFFAKGNPDSISIGKKTKNDIINSRSISAGGALTLKTPSSSVKPRSVSENRLGIDLSLLFDSEEEEENDATYDKIPNDLELELSSSENNPTKQGDLLGQLDLDLLELSENDEDGNELMDNNQNEGSTYAPKIKDEPPMITVAKNTKKIIPLSSASLKHVQNVSKITDESESLPNNSRYTHREIIQSRVISDIPVDFARIQELKATPQNLHKQKDFTREQVIVQRQASIIENINSPILKKTRQQLKSVNKQSPKKSTYNFAPQSNSIMDINEEFDNVRNVSLRDASIHSPKRLKKLIMSEEIKNAAVIPDDEKSINESGASKSPSVIINKPEVDDNSQDKSKVSFNVQELEPSTPQKNAEGKVQVVDQEKSVLSPIKRPIVMESPVHSEIKKFTSIKSSPSKVYLEPQQEVIGDDSQDSNSDLLRSFNNNRSMLSNPKDNELLDLHRNTSADSIELINSQPDDELAGTDLTFKDVLGLGIAQSTLHIARRTLFVSNLAQAASLSLKTHDMREFAQAMPTMNASVLENEKEFHKALLEKHYTSQKTLIMENHQRMIQRVDDCDDLNILINLYNKLK